MIDLASHAFRKVLVLCAHTDDEFGCAATVSRLLEQGAEVHYVALSRCEESVPDGFAKDVLEHECRDCTAALGIPKENVQVHGFRVRHFPQYRQDILELMIGIRRELSPDLVLLPSSFDTHQDHKTVYEEGFRAFKQCSLFGYELPQNLISFSNSCFVKVGAAHVERKIQALDLYKSQAFRPYAARDFIVSLAKVRGVQCGAEYAEAFEVVRLILQ